MSLTSDLRGSLRIVKTRYFLKVASKPYEKPMDMITIRSLVIGDVALFSASLIAGAAALIAIFPSMQFFSTPAPQMLVSLFAYIITFLLTVKTVGTLEHRHYAAVATLSAISENTYRPQPAPWSHSFSPATLQLLWPLERPSPSPFVPAATALNESCFAGIDALRVLLTTTKKLSPQTEVLSPSNETEKPPRLLKVDRRALHQLRDLDTINEYPVLAAALFSVIRASSNQPCTGTAYNDDVLTNNLHRDHVPGTLAAIAGTIRALNANPGASAVAVSLVPTFSAAIAINKKWISPTNDLARLTSSVHNVLQATPGPALV
jgi:hypothetical protein